MKLIKLDVGVRLAIEGLTEQALPKGDVNKSEVLVLSKEGLGEYLTCHLIRSLTMKVKAVSAADAVKRFEAVLQQAAYTASGLVSWDSLYEGYGSPKHGFNWSERIANWSDETVLLWFSTYEKTWLLSTKRSFAQAVQRDPASAMTVLPFFKNHVLNLEHTKTVLQNTVFSVNNLEPLRLEEACYRSTLITNTTQKEETMFDKLKNQNVEAVKLAGQLTVGKTANNLLADALLSKLPWYSRLLGGSALKESPFAKLATANLAVVLSTHFGKGNEQLAYVTDAMLKDAMVELVRDGEIVENLLSQLSGLAGTVTGSETK